MTRVPRCYAQDVDRNSAQRRMTQSLGRVRPAAVELLHAISRCPGTTSSRCKSDVVCTHHLSETTRISADPDPARGQSILQHNRDGHGWARIGVHAHVWGGLRHVRAAHHLCYGRPHRWPSSTPAGPALLRQAPDAPPLWIGAGHVVATAPPRCCRHPLTSRASGRGGRGAPW